MQFVLSVQVTVQMTASVQSFVLSVRMTTIALMSISTDGQLKVCRDNIICTHDASAQTMSSAWMT